MTVIPCIRGKIGNTTYYQGKMLATELASQVSPAYKMEDWSNDSIEERYQREPNQKRILEEIAPYLANNEDRFFGSLIVLVKGSLDFEPLAEFSGKTPKAYANAAKDLGFLTLGQCQLVALDGQHRLIGIQHVVTKNVTGPFSSDVHKDEVVVIFIEHQDLQKTRNIFNKVNRYARSTNRGENIITSEDDICSIIARMLMREGAPLGIKLPVDGARTKTSNSESNETEKKQALLAAWKHNTLSARSPELTTMSVLYDSSMAILSKKSPAVLEKSYLQQRPVEEEINKSYREVETVWKAVLSGVTAYKVAINDLKSIPKMRADTAPSSLLFRPYTQTILFQALSCATFVKGVPPRTAIDRINKVKWSMNDEFWQDILIINKKMNTTKEGRELAARTLTYLLASDKMDKAEIKKAKEDYSHSRGKKGKPLSPLPGVRETNL